MYAVLSELKIINKVYPQSSLTSRSRCPRPLFSTKSFDDVQETRQNLRESVYDRTEKLVRATLNFFTCMFRRDASRLNFYKYFLNQWIELQYKNNF